MAETQAVVSFAKPRNRSNVRKRAQPDDEEEDDTMVVRKDKIQKAALNFTTKKDTPGSKRVVFQYDSSRMVQQSGDQGATKVSEEDTERDRDARLVSETFFEQPDLLLLLQLPMASLVIAGKGGLLNRDPLHRALREQVLRQATEGHQDDGTYRGLNNYTDHKKGFRREHNVGAEKGSGLHGPLRGSAHIRTTVRFDYQPDLCKDYKETGYCGYGDACKFVHDRSDYKSGWELDRVRCRFLAPPFANLQSTPCIQPRILVGRPCLTRHVKFSYEAHIQVD